MTRVLTLAHQFVDHAPETLEEVILYISIPFTSAQHLCCCGCGREVVTPLTPRDWRLIFDGQTVSLEPSIDNWSFPCRSHYWIRRNTVRWALRRPLDHIDVGRAPIRGYSLRGSSKIVVVADGVSFATEVESGCHGRSRVTLTWWMSCSPT